jgi:hypothetical protein
MNWRDHFLSLLTYSTYLLLIPGGKRRKGWEMCTLECMLPCTSSLVFPCPFTGLSPYAGRPLSSQLKSGQLKSGPRLLDPGTGQHERSRAMLLAKGQERQRFATPPSLSLGALAHPGRRDGERKANRTRAATVLADLRLEQFTSKTMCFPGVPANTK